MQTRIAIWLGGVGLTLAAASASAQQVPPFFGGGVVAYDPEVSVINSGQLLDVRGTVSADRKYVTLEMRATSNNLRALTPVPVVVGPQGFVGGVNLPTAGAGGNVAGGGAGAGNNAAANANAAAAARGASRSSNQAARGTAAPAAPSPADTADAANRAAKAWVLARQGMYLVKPLN